MPPSMCVCVCADAVPVPKNSEPGPGDIFDPQCGAAHGDQERRKCVALDAF